MNLINGFFIVILGLGSGLVVGSGIVAFITVLGIIPRLTQLSKTSKFVQLYEWMIVGGAVTGSFMSLREPVLHGSPLWLVPIGFTSGIFVGMLAAALTEVLNVLPILAKRIGVAEQMLIILTALVLGKVLGSLFHWIYFVDL